MIVAAARRFALLLAVLTAAIVVGSALVGLVAGASLNRAVSLGFYCIGSLAVLGGFAFGNRGPVRRDQPPGHEDPMVPALKRPVRRATLDELYDAVNTSVLLVGVGLVLIAIGLAIDDRTELV
jgi:hypothetical protein